MRIRIKYTITILLIIIGTIMNFMGIQIQETYVRLIQFLIGALTTGFVAKKITDVFKK